MRRNIEDDIKLGAGGIREIEFIVQVFQLIYGGSRNVNYKIVNVWSSLHHLGNAQLLRSTGCN